MNLLRFLNSGIKISSSDSGCCTEFIIRYPREMGKCIDIGNAIIGSILNSSTVIVRIDTSLSFAVKKDMKMLTEKLKSLLKSMRMDFQSRMVKSASANQNSLARLFQFGNKSEPTELIVFALPGKFAYTDLLETILELGCEIFVPFEDSDITSTIQEIFNGYYDDNDNRFDRFKFIMFLNNYVEQAAIRTKHLSLKDVEGICSN